MAVTSTQAVSVLGELFQVGKRPNNFLRLIGATQGHILTTGSREFPTNVLYTLRSPGQNVALEGANAPAAQTVTVSQATNVIQIHQETVALTYLGQSDHTVTGVVPIPMGQVQGNVVNPRSESFQVGARMETIQRDVNWSCLRGTYANPADPTGSALKTRGILTAITTNVVDGSADAIAADPYKQYRNYITNMIAGVVATNGFNPDLSWVLFGDITEYQNIAAAFKAAGTQFVMPEAEVMGIKVRKVITDIGTFVLALEPDMPAHTVLLADLSVVGLVGLPVPEKGIIFMEPLAKTGSADTMQIYGQLGLDHGPEFCHGKLIVPSTMILSE